MIEVSIGEGELELTCATMALVRMLISYSNLSKRADW
jgi:hypothetical protein